MSRGGKTIEQVWTALEEVRWQYLELERRNQELEDVLDKLAEKYRAYCMMWGPGKDKQLYEKVNAAIAKNTGGKI